MANKKFNFADAANTPIAQSATETMAKAYNQAPPNLPQGEELSNASSTEQTANTQPPTPNTQPPTPSVSTPVEHLASRRIQIQSEYNDAAVQAINLKTFPEAGNWKLEEVVRMFNLKRTPGTPKLTKGALAEMLLLDAANDLYEKVCGR